MTAVADTSELAQFLQRTWQAHAQGRAVARYERLASTVDQQLGALDLDGLHPAQHEIRAEQGLGELQPALRKQLERLLDQERMAWIAAHGQSLPAEAHRDFGAFARGWLEQCRSAHLSEERETGSPMRQGYFYDRRIPGDHLTSQFLVGASGTVTQLDAWHSRDGLLVPQTGSALLQHVVAVAEHNAERRTWTYPDRKERYGWSTETSDDFHARAVAFLGIRDRDAQHSLSRYPEAVVLVKVTRAMDHGVPLQGGSQTRLVVEGCDISELAKSSAAPESSYDYEWWAKECEVLAALGLPPTAAGRVLGHRALAEDIERRFHAPVLQVPDDGIIRGRVASVLATEHGTRAVVQAEAGLYLFGGGEQSISQWRALQGMPVQLSRTDEGVRLELLSGHRRQRALQRDVELET